jgi:hypothetical protein
MRVELVAFWIKKAIQVSVLCYSLGIWAALSAIITLGTICKVRVEIMFWGAHSYIKNAILLLAWNWFIKCKPPIQWVPGALSLGVKRPGREADHSPPSSAEVKEWVELYLHSPNTPSWRGAYLKHRDNFTFIYAHIGVHIKSVTL